MADQGVLHLPPEQPRQVKAYNPEDLDEKFAHVADKNTPGTVLYNTSTGHCFGTSK
jgi:hypothetical protein